MYSSIQQPLLIEHINHLTGLLTEAYIADGIVQQSTLIQAAAPWFIG